ncbi:hypothetical protein BKA69DRAFT_97830 [Paraphysoderma sedebokerense]|nr:hypothetical protein BKA69DRAFT_97830 [Paraphysoderma sedebokerense]
MSGERYMQIVMSKTLRKSHITLIVGGIWANSVITGFLPLITGSYYWERPCQVWCVPDYTGDRAKNLPFKVMSQTLLWTALIGIPLCYWRIYKFAVLNGFKWGVQKGVVTAVVGASYTSVTNHMQYVHDSNSNIEGTKPSPGKVQEDLNAQSALHSQLRLTKRLALVVVQFYIGWFGLATCFMYETIQQSKVTPLTDFCLGLTNVSTWILNPLILLTLDSRLKIRVSRRR